MKRLKHSEPEAHSAIERSLKSPLLFTVLTVALVSFWPWPKRWALSGAPLLYACILVGESKGYRVLPSFGLWAIFTSLNLVYAICSTSWLLYWVFVAGCYPAIGLVCLFQFSMVANFARRRLRAVLKQLHFIDDKIALFDLPALEIDTEVDGLFVMRGITFSLSSLSLVVHGIEVGIKLSDDMEMAIQCEKATVKFFRGIWVEDCFANIKGGTYEMTFGEMGGKSTDSDGDSIFVEGSELLKAALRDSDRRSFDSTRPSLDLRSEKMAAEMTDGNPPEAAPVEEGLSGIKTLSPDYDEARKTYLERLKFIEDTDTIAEARAYVKRLTRQTADAERSFDVADSNAMRAAICSHIHNKPSVPHPPQKSIKVTTLQNLSSPRVKAFMHRLPMLLRLLLNPLSYFHPVHIKSITATASGRWIDSLLVAKVFQSYADTDAQINGLKKRVSAWLSDANFAIELAGITGQAQVPFVPTYNIKCDLALNDVMAYRSLPKQVDLKQVVRLGGADAAFVIPSFLLPHHEHLLPPVPSTEDKANLSENIESADGKPKEIQAEHELKQAEKDETNVKISVHARLPACFDQELLDFVSALVKATKIVEMEKESGTPMDEEVHGIRDFAGAVRATMKDGLKRKVVDGVVNDRWIAKMVGKITKKLETAQGEAGYSGDIPVALGIYRTDYLETEGEKLLP